MSAPEPTGVIHDIGYRPYEGRRLGRGYALRSLYVQSLRHAYGLGRSARSKVMPVLLFVLMVIPAAVMVGVVNLVDMQAQVVPYTRYAMIMQAVIGIFLAAQAPVLVARDLRFATISLYFSRPPTRLDYVLAKYAAMASALFVLMGIPLAILYVGGLLAKFPAWPQTRDFALGLAGVVAFSLVLAGLGLLLAALTTRRGLGVAVIIGVLLVSFAGVSAVQGIAGVSGSDAVAGYAGIFSPFTLVDGFQAGALGADSSAVAGPPGTAGGIVFTLAMLAVIGGTFGLLALRYAKAASS
ncbi:MAG: ABC transporter permease [Nocardioidaceae bacterium]